VPDGIHLHVCKQELLQGLDKMGLCELQGSGEGQGIPN
jgi:hypothetical protein